MKRKRYTCPTYLGSPGSILRRARNQSRETLHLHLAIAGWGDF